MCGLLAPGSACFASTLFVAGACMRAGAGEYGPDQQHSREHGNGQVLRQPPLNDRLRQEREGGHCPSGDTALRRHAEIARAGDLNNNTWFVFIANGFALLVGAKAHQFPVRNACNRTLYDMCMLWQMVV